MNAQDIMAELDENKQNIPENLYIQLANLLKEKHEYQVQSKHIQHNDVESDEDDIIETNEDLNRSISTCIKFLYRQDYEEIFKKYLKIIPFENYYIIIEENNVDTYDDDIEQVREIITEFVLDSLPIEAFEEIINKEGGIERGINRLKIYLGDDYKDRYESLPKYHQMRTMTYYIMDCLIYEYQYVERNIPLLLQHNVVELRTFLKTLEQTFRMYLCNKPTIKDNY